MTAPRFLLVLTRAQPSRDASAAALGAAAGRMLQWVAGLRRWGLLSALAAVPASSGPVRGCLLVTATDAAAAHGLAASCPVGPVLVMPLVEEVGSGGR